MSQNSVQRIEEGQRGGACMMVMFATEKLHVQRRSFVGLNICSTHYSCTPVKRFTVVQAVLQSSTQMDHSRAFHDPIHVVESKDSLPCPSIIKYQHVLNLATSRQSRHHSRHRPCLGHMSRVPGRLTKAVCFWIGWSSGRDSMISTL